jgi:hypothetical protein
MKLFLRRNAPLFYALGAMLALYIPWLNRGYSNWEWPHVLAGEALAYPEKIGLLDAYWSTGQANPLGYPLFNALLQRLVPWTDAPWLWRVPSLVGCGLIVTWGWLVRDEFGKEPGKKFLLWTILLLSSPLIVAYSSSATSDLLPVGLLLMSFWLIRHYVSNQSKRFLVIGALVFGVSCAVRYISPYFFGFFAFSLLGVPGFKASKKIIDLTVFSLISGAILFSEIAWKFWAFDVLISTRLDQNGPNFLDFKSWIVTFVRYSSLLGLFCGVVWLVGVPKKLFARIGFFLLGATATVSALLAFFVSQQEEQGEMNFGLGFPFSNFVTGLFSAVGIFGSVFIFLSFANQIKQRDRFSSALMAGAIPCLVLMSASRPTQRYLLYFIPILLFVLARLVKFKLDVISWAYLSLTVVVFVASSFYGMLFLRSQGDASESMALWVKENGLIDQTSVSSIWPHAGQHWWGIVPGQTRYEIIAVTPSAEVQLQERVLHREPMKVLGKVTRVYLLREIPVSP